MRKQIIRLLEQKTYVPLSAENLQRHLRLPPDRHFCIYALASVIPFLAAKQRQLEANDWLARDSLIACPDPDDRLIMKIERIAKRTLDSNELT